MKEDTQLDFKEIYDFAIDVAEKAGHMLVTASQHRTVDQNIRLKKNTVDIVTETDEKVEQFIKNEITKKYPEHKFIGEETYSAGQEKKYLVDNDPTWIVDPLDGTVNYVHLFPMICVSIGFAVGGKAVVGVVHAPFLNQTYSAYPGGGAWLNNQRLPLQNLPLPEEAPRGCIFLCEWGKDRRYEPGLNLQRKVDSFINMATDYCHGVRSLGSASLDLCFVASGAFDIWWEGGCWEWDVAGAVAILNEAKGLVTTGNPPEDTAIIPEVKLGSRLYLAIRPCDGNETETSRESQERVVRQIWKRVHALDYNRP